MSIRPGRLEQEKYQRIRREALLKRETARVGTDCENKSTGGLKSLIAPGSSGIEELNED